MEIWYNEIMKQHKNKQLEEKISELENNWKRAAADFENYRKRIEEQKSQWIAGANADLILKLTPILDNFRRAVEHSPENNEWANGVLAIEKQLEKLFEDEGVIKISPNENEPFNPNIHEAVSHEPNEKVKADHIIAVVENGWQLEEKILKPAKVRVSAGSVL